MDLIGAIVIDLLKSGLKLLVKQFGTDLNQIITQSIAELSKVSPEYDSFSNALSEIIKKGTIKIERLPEGKDKLAGEIASKISESPFFNTYCDPATYPQEKVKEILTEFMDILEKNLVRNPQLSSLLNLSYQREILKEVGLIRNHFEQTKRPIPQRREEGIAIANMLSFDKETAVTHRLNRKSEKFKYLSILFKYALNLDSHKEYDKALRKYRTFLKDKDSQRHSRYFGVLNNIGKILAEQRKPKEALKYLKQAQQVAPRRSAAMLNLAVAYFYARNLDMALSYALMAKPKRRNDPNLYNTLAIIYAEKGQSSLSFKMINTAIRIDKKFAPAYANRALLYGEKKAFEKAERDIQRAIVLDNINAYFYITYGVLLQMIFYASFSEEISFYGKESETYYIKSEDLESLTRQQTDILDKSIEKFERAIELGIQLEKNSVLSTNLAASYHVRKRYKEAERVYKKIKVKREEDYPWQGLGDLYFQTARPKLAIKCYKKLLHLQPKNAHVHTALVRTYGEMNDLENALKHAKEACRLAPEDQRCKFNLGFAYELMGRLQPAQETFEYLRDIRFDIGSVNFHLGRIYFLQQMYGSATECFLEARRHGVPRKILSELLAVSAGSSQKWDVSEEEFKFLLSEDPNNFLHNFNYAQFMEMKRNIDNATKHYMKAIHSPGANKYPQITKWIKQRLQDISKQSRRIIQS